jgi:hypothetical protein
MFPTVIETVLLLSFHDGEAERDGVALGALSGEHVGAHLAVSTYARNNGSVMGLGCADGSENARENKCKGLKMTAHDDPCHARKKLGLRLSRLEFQTL